MIRSLFSGDKPVALAILLAVVVAVTLIQIFVLPPAAEGTPFIASRSVEDSPELAPVSGARRPVTSKRPPGEAPARFASPGRAGRSERLLDPESPGGAREPAGAVHRSAEPGMARGTSASEARRPARSPIRRAETLAAEDINPTGAGVVPVPHETPGSPSGPAAYQVPIQPQALPVPVVAGSASAPAAEPVPAGPAGAVASPVHDDPPLQTDVTPDLDAGGTQLVVLGPSAASAGDTVTYLISTENASNISHAPLQIVYDPEVLEFVEAAEGSLMSAGGASTFFMASGSSAPGLIHVALSRMPPAGGVDGSGVLCSLTFRAKKAGESPIITAGSRLLDQSAHAVELRRNDSYVAVR